MKIPSFEELKTVPEWIHKNIKQCQGCREPQYQYKYIQRQDNGYVYEVVKLCSCHAGHPSRINEVLVPPGYNLLDWTAVDYYNWTQENREKEKPEPNFQKE